MQSYERYDRMEIMDNKLELKDLYIGMEIRDKAQLSSIYDTWIMLVKNKNSDVYTVGFIGSETNEESDSCLHRIMSYVRSIMTALNLRGIFIMKNKYIIKHKGTVKK